MSLNMFMRLTAAAGEDNRRARAAERAHEQRQADRPLYDVADKLESLMDEYVGSIDRFKNVFGPLDITEDPEGRAVELMVIMRTLRYDIPHGVMAGGYTIANLGEKLQAFRDWVAARPEIKISDPFLARLDATLAEAQQVDFFSKIVQPSTPAAAHAKR